MKLQLRLLLLSVIVLLTGCLNELPTIPKEMKFISTINIKEMTMSFIDMENEQLFNEWKLKKPYTGGLLLPDKDTILLYGKQVDSIDLYSLSKGKKVNSWDTGKGIVTGHLLGNTNMIAFADQNLHQMRFFSLSGEELGFVKTGKNPVSILQGMDQDQLYVMSFDDELLTIVNVSEMKIDTSFPIHTNAAGALVLENQNELWIGGHGERNTIEHNIHVYDLTNGHLKKKISAPTMPINFIEKNGSVFVLSHGTSHLYQFNSKGEMLGTVQVGANPFEISIFDGNLIIAGYDSNDIHIIEMDKLKLIKSIHVGKGPFKIISRE